MNEIMFLIEDDPDGGYNAQALGYSIFTEGETVSEIKENIVDALSCHFDNLEDIPKVIIECKNIRQDEQDVQDLL